MAGKFEQFKSLVEEFNANNGVKFNFERYEIKLNQTNHMREFFTSKGEITAEDFAYRSVAKEIFREAVESMITKKAKAVDYSAFLKDFDKLMDSYREYCGQTNTKKPSKNGGWGNSSKMIEEFQGKIRDIPDDKSDFIKNNYVARSLRLRDMRADLESMGKDEKPITAEELSRAIVYKRALEKAISERSFGWRAIHWFQGPAEKRDLETIKKFIAKHDENSEVYKQAEAFANENAVGQLRSKLEEAKKEIEAKEQLKPRKLENAKQGNERMNNRALYVHLEKLSLNIVEESASSIESKKAIISAVLGSGIGNIRQMWAEFEKATSGEAKENVILKRTQKIFNETYNLVKGLNFDEKTKEHDAIVASQRFTDMMLKQYSPAMNGKEYNKYFDSYVVKDEKFIENFMKTNFGIEEMTDEQVKEIVNDLTLDLADKKKISIVSGDVISDNNKKSERVQQSSREHDKVKAQ